MTKKVCIAFASGCPRTEIDCAHLKDYFAANEWDVVLSLKTADLVLLSTCAFSERPERVSLKFLKAAKSNIKENAELIVFGCLPEINGKLLKKYFSGQTLTPTTLSKIDNLINAKVPLADIPEPHFIDGSIANARKAFTNKEIFIANFSPKWDYCIGFMKRRFGYLGFNNRVLTNRRLRAIYDDVFVLRISKGCTNRCSYCAVRNAHGSLSSEGLEAIMSDFQQGLDNGARTFELMGADIGAYGQDRGSNIVELLNRMFAINENYTLLLSEFNFRWFIRYRDELIDLISRNKKRVGYLMLPIQSGSDTVLDKMKRGHSASSALEAVLRLKEAAPGIKVTTHVMIGFPGETDDDFLETCRFLHTGQFDEIVLFPYSDRPNTAAMNFPDKVPMSVITKRVKYIRKEFGSICRGGAT